MLFRDEDSDDDDSENDGPIEIQPASHEITPQDGATKLDLAVSALSRTLAQPADQRKKPPPVPPGAEGQGKKPALTLLDTDEDKPANTAKPVVQEKPTPSSGESSDSDDHSVASSKTGIVDELASDGGSQSGQHDEAVSTICPNSVVKFSDLLTSGSWKKFFQCEDDAQFRDSAQTPLT